MKRFEELIAPHLDAAYNLARWLTGNDSAARDVVQESALRAFRFLQRFADGNPKAWFLTIVRNESYTWLKASAGHRWVAIGDELPEDYAALSPQPDPGIASDPHRKRRADPASAVRPAAGVSRGDCAQGARRHALQGHRPGGRHSHRHRHVETGPGSRHAQARTDEVARS